MPPPKEGTPRHTRTRPRPPGGGCGRRAAQSPASFGDCPPRSSGVLRGGPAPQRDACFGRSWRVSSPPFPCAPAPGVWGVNGIVPSPGPFVRSATTPYLPRALGFYRAVVRPVARGNTGGSNMTLGSCHLADALGGGYVLAWDQGTARPDQHQPRTQNHLRVRSHPGERQIVQAIASSSRKNSADCTQLGMPARTCVQTAIKEPPLFPTPPRLLFFCVFLRLALD